MRSPVFRATFSPEELVCDNFAGGGGASTGIEAALGRPVDIAINHDPEAIAMHKANHPETKHYCENIWEVDPREACGSRPVGLAWFSPDCTHHSRAKNGKPRKQDIRGLAWVGLRWAKSVRPRMMIYENVGEFQTWGPLDFDGRIIKERSGETFKEWIAAHVAEGYSIEYDELVAADFGTPTTRKRLYVIARLDGRGIAWPRATHGKGLAPWRPAAEIIDWALPCPSIFDRTKPLAEATQRRIAEGIRRFVIESAEPFIIPVTHPRDARVHGIGDPLRTVTAAHRGELALVAPTLIQTSYGERKGQRPRYLDIHKPLGTVVAGGQKHALVAALITKHYGGPGPNSHFVVGHEMDRTLGTITGQDHHALTAAFLTKFYGTAVGAPVGKPLPTVTANGRGGGHLAEVRAFLVKYYKTGSHTQDLSDPLHTVTAKARFGLVMVYGEPYQIVDIGMRMLQPHELYAAQGFPGGYQIAPEFRGKPLTKTAQIKMAGNSVCPPVAEAIVGANVRPQPIEVAA
jgi:DNA (cytosine-5)-methyltransferase 1